MIAQKANNINSVQKLQRSLYMAAKDDPRRAFYSLFDKVYRPDILAEAYRRARRNGGVSGVDNQTWENTDQGKILTEIHEELKNGTYRFSPVKRVHIPKSDGTQRGLGIPTIKDRIVETAMCIVMEPIFEAGYYKHSYGFRPKRNAHQMVDAAGKFINAGYSICLDVDIRKFFDNVDHRILMRFLARRIQDGRLLRTIKEILKAPIWENGQLTKAKIGCPQGSPLSPLLANVYLSSLDLFFIKKTMYKESVLLRYADDILVVARPEFAGKARMVLKEGLKWLKLEANPEKSRIFDLNKPGRRITILGFDIIRYRDGKLVTLPSRKATKSFKAKLRSIICRNNPSDIKDIVKAANLMMGGWVQYFAFCQYKHPFIKLSIFCFLRVRKLLLKRAKARSWNRYKYSFKWIHRNLGLDSPYVHWLRARQRLNAVM
jgi:RNA-directed DNA polymerase